MLLIRIKTKENSTTNYSQISGELKKLEMKAIKTRRT